MFSRFVPQVGLVLALAVSLVVVPATTAASSPNVTSNDPPSLVEHLRTELGSNDAMRVQNALIDVISLASCPNRCTVSLQSAEEKNIRIENETNVGAALDLSALAPDLLTTYRSGPADGHRLLALSALIKIGNDKVLAQLLEEESSQSEKVAQETQRSLAHYYLTKYPELVERAERKKTFSIEDVQRAEAVRVKLAKKESKN